jgi:Lrp/AsnC family transcriptional regulator for asnA, asnC and gidA
MIELDEYDRAILAELQDDGRMPVAQLSSVVGLSQTATRHRLQKMLSSDAIRVVALGDPSMMGFDVEAMIGICVDGDPHAAAEAIGKIPEVMNVMLCAGRFVLMVEVICRNNVALENLMTKQLHGVEGVKSLEVFIYLDCTKDSYNWCNL